MKTITGAVDHRSRCPSPFHSGVTSRLFHSIALTPAAPIIAHARPRVHRISFSDDVESRLTNISTQAFLSPTTGPIIAGFIIGGSTPKRILLRAAGPTLAEFGLVNWLAYPRIQLFNSAGTPIGENDNPGLEADDIPTWTEFAGAFPFRPGNRDAARVATLAPGAYTAHVSSHSNNACGISVVEAYEIMKPDETLDGRRLTNLSTLAQVSPGGGVLITRFSVFGKSPRRLLIRGIGPGLADYGVIDSVPDPRIELYSPSALIAGNDNWDDMNSAEIVVTSARCGAFPLRRGRRDAALLVTLDSGDYTVVLRSTGGVTGRGLIEVYEAPE